MLNARLNNGSLEGSVVDDGQDAIAELVFRMEQHHIGDASELATIRLARSSLEDIPVRLRREINATVPILRLPTEILLEISDNIALSDPPRPVSVLQQQGRFGDYHSPTLGWIRLTHVCHRMRDALIESPILWARVVCSLPKAHEVLLRRTRSAPLSIVMDSWRYDVPERFLTSLLDQPLVLLETLTLGTLTMVPQDFRFPPSPHLRELRLHNIFIRVTGCSTLTHLEISQDYFEPIPVEHFLEVLSSSPCLESIVLTRCIPSADQWTILQDESLIVSLPRLRELCVAGPCSWCIPFWAHIAVPPTASLHFDIDRPSVPVTTPPWYTLLNTDRLGFMRSLAPHFRAFADQRCTMVGMSVATYNSMPEEFRLRLYAVGAGVDAAHEQEVRSANPILDGCRLVLEVKFYRWEVLLKDVVNVIGLVAYSFDLSRVQLLDIGLQRSLDNLPNIDASQWRDALSPLSSVSQLYVGPAHKDVLLKALQEPLSTSTSLHDPGDHCALLFPNLHTLHLGIFAPHDLGYSRNPLESSASLRTAMMKIFPGRSRRGLNVMRVQIASYGDDGTSKLARDLHEIVPDVHVCLSEVEVRPGLSFVSVE
ncbi:hypothetical protein OF83DRAFT_1171085 [Amylostereum chailletii]|nr:hypothetical protein OF83DRAFT_1171085 [Amylostereum chailletii]